jgi:hypothetical protein
MRSQAATLAVLTLTVFGCSNVPSNERVPSWVSGDYQGMLTAPASPDCGFNAAVFEPFTWTISTTPDTIRIVQHSPYKNTFTYTSRLRANGGWWDLSGPWEGTGKMGSGTFVGRFLATDHAIVFVYTVTWTTRNSCVLHMTLAGARSHSNESEPK